MVVPLPRLIRTAGWARIGLLVLLDADVIIVGDLLLLFVIPPVFLSCLCRPILHINASFVFGFWFCFKARPSFIGESQKCLKDETWQCCLDLLEGKGTSIGTAVVMFVGVDWAVRLARLARFDFGQAQSKSVVFGHDRRRTAARTGRRRHRIP